MPRNFVIACGGTGGRCAEALAYLYASRAILDSAHILIIDPDHGNGNIEDAVRQLRNYSAVHSTLLNSARTADRPFFNAGLNEKLGSFFWANPNSEKKWADKLDYASSPASTKGLIDLLYDESDLAMSFEQGYVGRAHIGSLDLLRTLEPEIKLAKDRPNKDNALHVFMQELRTACGAGGNGPGGDANLLVIGSIFGGTGASAVPAIPPLIKEALGELRERLRLACVQVAPYFSFPQGGDEDPDSALHPVATRTALGHYGTTPVGYDRIYLVGGHERRSTAATNRRGGGEQRNSTHHIEIVAGLAAAHFFRAPPVDRQERAELFVSNAQPDLGWNKLPGNAGLNLRQNLVSFTTFSLMHSMFLDEEVRTGRHRGRTWMASLQQGTRDLTGTERQFEALTLFTTRYLSWLRSVQAFSGASLFSVDSAASQSANSLGSVVEGGAGVGEAFDGIMQQLESKTGSNPQEVGVGFYVQALTRAVDGFCRSHYHNWTQAGSAQSAPPLEAARV